MHRLSGARTGRCVGGLPQPVPTACVESNFLVVAPDGNNEQNKTYLHNL